MKIKVLLFAAISFSAQYISACPHLAGEYWAQGEDGRTGYGISQKGCEAVSISGDSFYLGKESVYTIHVKTDGISRPSLRDLFGGGPVNISAIFEGKELNVSHGDHDTSFELDKDGNLLIDGTVFERTNGKNESIHDNK